MTEPFEPDASPVLVPPTLEAPGPQPPVPPGPTGPVTPLAPRGGRAVLRWALAAFVTVAVAGVAVGGYLALQTAGQKPSVAAFLPADTLLYVEVTAEPSGDQKDKLLGLLKRFPGFEDQSRLDQKVEETFTRLLARTEIDYATQVKPWLGSSATFALRWTGGSAPTDVSVVLLLATTDDPKAAAFVDDLAEAARRAGGTVGSEDYRGVTITTLQDGVSAPNGSAMRSNAAVFVLEGQLVATNDVAFGRLIIDVRKGGGSSPAPEAASLAGKPLFRDALAKMPADRVATVYGDIGRFLDLTLTLARAQPNAAQIPPFEVTGEGAVAGYLRAEDDGALFDLSTVGDLEVAAGTPLPLSSPPAELGKDRASRLDAAIPAGALLTVDIHDLGPALRYGVTSIRAAQPELEATFKQLDQALALMGTGLDGLLGLFSDAALVVAPNGANPDGGLLAEVSDTATAERLIGQIDAFLALAGGGNVRTEEYRGVTLHQIDLSDSGVEGLPPVTPTYGVSGDVLIVALDTAFAHAVIDVQNGADALSDQESYRAVLARVGAENGGAVFLDVHALIGLAKSAGSPLPDDVAAYLEPISAVGFAATGGGVPSAKHSRFFVLIK